MTRRRYLKPAWMQRHVGNRLAPRFRPSPVSKLSAPGRRTGRRHTRSIVVLDHDSERSLVSIRGKSDRALDLPSAHRARLPARGHVEEITIEEIPLADRGPDPAAYAARYHTMPTVAATPARPARSGRPPDVPDHRLRPGRPYPGLMSRSAPTIEPRSTGGIPWAGCLP